MQSYEIRQFEKLKNELREVREELSKIRREVDAACEALSEEDAAFIRSLIWPDDRKVAVLQRHISELDVGNRVYGRLRYVHLESIADVARHSEQELLAIPNLGQVGLEEIKSALDKVGVELRT
jgi:DNA-directed RNA polymerase alpha subunit